MAVDLEYYGVPPADYRITENRTRLTASAGQTAFAAPYAVGYVDVYFNGAKLDPSTEFTATDGANVTLSTAAILGDVVEIISRAQVQLSNIYTQPQVNALVGNYYGPATGTGDAQIVTTTPAFSTLQDDMVIRIRAVAANTLTTPTINVNGTGVITVVRDGGLALTGGDWNTNSELTVRYIQSSNRWAVVDGLVTATTPSLFDVTSKYATTGFVKNAGLIYGGITTYSTTQSLTNTAAGQQIYLTGSSTYVITLPALSTMPVGSTISFFCVTSGSSIVGIARAGTDTITPNFNGGVTQINIRNGDTLTLVSSGSNYWVAISGSVQLGYSNAFASLISTAGYQKLPSGIIIQWAGGTASTAGVTNSYPTAFPSAIFAITATTATNNASFAPVGVSAGSLTSYTAYCTSGSVSHEIIAVGQ